MTTLNLQVAASADDGWQSGAGVPNIATSTLELGQDGSGNLSALARFLNVTIPQGTTITSATFTVRCVAGYTGPSTLIVNAQAENVDNSATISASANHIGARAVTSSPTSWDIHIMATNTEYSVDVTSHVQAVLNRAGWVSGNALSIIITNNTAPSNEWQDVYTYDNTPANAPKLDIVYSGGSPQTVTIESVPPRNAFGTQNTFETAAFVPTSDISAGAWTTEVGGTSNLYASVDETSANDADYIQSEAAPAASAVQVKFASMTDPAVSYGHYITYRIQKTGTGQINMVVRLKQNTTTIASWSHTNVDSAVTEYTQTLSSAEADSITDYTDLRVEFEGTQV